MATETTFVYADLEGVPSLVGRLCFHSKAARESASFEYDGSWLSSPHRFSLNPALALVSGSFHSSSNTLFGSLGDSAPDRWGRALMRRDERRQALADRRTPRTLREIDYLLMVDDEARQGALRFSRSEGGPFLSEPKVSRIPPLLQLAEIMFASERVVADKDNDEDLRLLLGPGSSLGGARPKASVRDRDGSLMIAKFQRQDDEFNNVLWEALTLSLAKQAGINTAESRLETVHGRSVLMLRRFDRDKTHRLPFLSGMSMLAANDNETRSYLELADVLRRFGGSPAQDISSLWRRVAFNVLVSNTDDHLRNHGFLYNHSLGGWLLSPAYDLNPVPAEIKPRFLSTAIDAEDTTASIDLAMSVTPYFGLSMKGARDILKQVVTAVSRWREEALRIGVRQEEIARMASAFEHEDLRRARLICGYTHRE